MKYGGESEGSPVPPRPHYQDLGYVLWKSSCRDRTSLKRMPSCLAICPASSWGPCSPTAALSMSSSITFGSIDSNSRLIFSEKLGSFSLRTELGCLSWCHDLTGGHSCPLPSLACRSLGANALLKGCPRPSQQPTNSSSAVYCVTSQPQLGAYLGLQCWHLHRFPQPMHLRSTLRFCPGLWLVSDLLFLLLPRSLGTSH